MGGGGRKRLLLVSGRVPGEHLVEDEQDSVLDVSQAEDFHDRPRQTRFLPRRLEGKYFLVPCPTAHIYKENNAIICRRSGGG